MVFHNPALLALLILAISPIVIHFLMRLRTRRVVWGGNYILGRALQRARKDKQWLYYLLLALRCLVAGLLIFAFARPFWLDPEGRQEAAGDRHQVIVLNDGFNLHHTAEGLSLWEHGLRKLERLHAGWPVGTRYSIYSVAGGLRPVVENQRREGADGELRSLLAQVSPRDGRVDLVESLTELQRTLRGEAVRLIVVSPEQASQWKNREHLNFGDASTLWLVPPPIEGWNVTIREIELPHESLLAGDSVRIFVRLGLSGSSDDRQSIVCELAVPGQPRLRQRVILQPGQEVRVPFDFEVPRTEGFLSLRVEVRDANALDWDNVAEAVVQVRGRARIGVIPAGPEARMFERSADWIHSYIASSEGRGLEMKALDVVDSGTLGEIDVLIADDVPAPSTAALAAIEAWVRHGGALILGGGPALQPDRWPNPLLGGHWEGMRLLPAGGGSYHRVERGSFDTAPVRAMSDAGSSGLGAIKVHSYWLVQPAENTDVLGFLDNGAPWLMATSLDRGRVVLLSSGLSGRWNNLPVLPAYPHALHRILSLALTSSAPPLNAQRDEGLLLAAEDGGRTLLSGPQADPDRTQIPLERTRRGGMDLLVAPTLPPRNGIYEVLSLEGNASPQRLIALQDPRESGRIDRIPESEQTAWLQRNDWTRISNDAELRRVLEAGGAGHELFTWMLAGMVLLLIAEGSIGRILAR